MPATWVPCSEFSESNGFAALRHAGRAGANARATITFGVVYAVCPFGKPCGKAKPAGLKNGWVWSTPSSRIPILIPLPPRDGSEPHSAGALICAGLRSRPER